MALAEYRIGELTLRPGRELRDGAAPVTVGSRTLALLSVLAEAGGAVLTKDDLFARVWGTGIVEENTLQAQVSQARKALGGEARRLVTVHGRGYRLDLDPPVAERGAEPDQASIAVLPFDNLTANAEHAYLADGLAEELISRLSRVTGLKVPARTSSFAYRGKASDIRRIATELGVATVLEGSVRAGGERLRVSAQLIDAGSGFHIWAQSFDRTMTDLLTLQDDLAEAIATALRRELGPRLRETHSAEAMRLVLQARAAARSFTAEGKREALRLARAALDLDPQFAKAWESLAGTTFVYSEWGFRSPESSVEAREYAQRALDLDPGLGGAQAIIAGLEATAGRLVEAAEGFVRASVTDPSNALIGEHAVLAVFLPTGMLTRAGELADASIALSPARAVPKLLRASFALVSGQAERAKLHLEDALRLTRPDVSFLVEFLQSEIALALGSTRAAAEPMVSLVAREFAVPGSADSVEAVFAAMEGIGDPSAASARATALFDAADRSGRVWGQSATAGLVVRWHVRLGALDAAFKTARRIVERWRESGRLAVGSLTSFWLPDMVPFRRDPRFQDLVRDLDLIRFWERHGPPDGHRLEGGELIVA